MKRFAQNSVFTETGLNPVKLSIWAGASHLELDQNGQAGVRRAARPPGDTPTDWTLRHGPRSRQPKLRPEAMRFARLDCARRSLRSAVTARGRAVTRVEGQKDMRRDETHGTDSNSLFQTKMNFTFRQNLTASPQFSPPCRSFTTERAFLSRLQVHTYTPVECARQARTTGYRPFGH